MKEGIKDRAQTMNGLVTGGAQKYYGVVIGANNIKDVNINELFVIPSSMHFFLCSDVYENEENANSKLNILKQDGITCCLINFNISNCDTQGRNFNIICYDKNDWKVSLRINDTSLYPKLNMLYRADHKSSRVDNDYIGEPEVYEEGDMRAIDDEYYGIADK